MAFATVTIEDKKNNIIKEAPVGFSWTVLFFGGFVPLVRGDWGWFFIMLIAGIVTLEYQELYLHLFTIEFIYKILYQKDLKLKATLGTKNLLRTKLKLKSQNK